jgi:hypothetical protein
LYVIDGAGTDERHPNDDFKSLMKELKLYDPELLKKPAVMFINKSDIIGNCLISFVFITIFIFLCKIIENVNSSASESLKKLVSSAKRRKIPVIHGRYGVSIFTYNTRLFTLLYSPSSSALNQSNIRDLAVVLREVLDRLQNSLISATTNK